MLKFLQVNQFALFDSIALEFAPGFNVLTGETGAGKSLLVDALAIITGSRATTEFVRKGADKTEITAVFEVTSSVQQWLEQNDLALPSEETSDETADHAGKEQRKGGDSQRELNDAQPELIVRRLIPIKGNSRAYINDHLVSLNTLKTLGQKLVQICGQHAHLAITQTENQRRLLDSYGGYDKVLDEVKLACLQWTKIKNELDQLDLVPDDHQNRMAFLSFLIEELNQFELDPEHIRSIEHQHKQLANRDTLETTVQQAMELIQGADSSASSLLASIINLLSPVIATDEKLESGMSVLYEAQNLLNISNEEFRHYLDSLENDPKLLAELEQTISALHDLSRKHRCKIVELKDKQRQLEEEYRHLAEREQSILNLQSKLQLATADYSQASDRLSVARQKTASQLGAVISEKIRHLGLPNARLVVMIESQSKQTPSINGNDKVVFHVSMNAGQEPAQMSKVASGGELSRLALAMHLVLNANKETTTLVFDEADAGIGGQAAEVVGQYMAELSQNAQVMCVTHLAPIACQAGQHIKVSKSSNDKSTVLKSTVLTDEDRVYEIARMISGHRINQYSLANARDMLGMDSQINNLVEFPS